MSRCMPVCYGVGLWLWRKSVVEVFGEEDSGLRIKIELDFYWQVNRHRE